MYKVLIGIVLAITVSTTAVGQSLRAGTWEASLLYKSQSGESFGAPEGPDEANVKFSSDNCVPDWYWGWYCYSSSYDKTAFSYNAALGLRADFNNNIFLRASYGRQWLDEKIGKDKPEFDIGKIEIGYRF